MSTRLLTIMGSGETAPTMVKVHRQVVQAVGSTPPGMLLDTPFGFQMNVDDLAARTVAYFADSVGVPLEVARIRTASDLAGPGADATVAALAAAPFVFAGPGSPTYALRQWRSSVVPAILREKLTYGGAVTFSSAAALTLGAFTVPVYEIYKVGQAPYWDAGLDLLRVVDERLCAAVVPHYDNAEGGTHDTRFCYLGEPRLARLQRELPANAMVLGVDEHTALVFDLGAGQVRVSGLGAVTVRVGSRSEVLTSGTTMAVGDLLAIADGLRRDPAPRHFLYEEAAAGTCDGGAPPSSAADAVPSASKPPGTTPATGAPGRWTERPQPGPSREHAEAGAPGTTLRPSHASDSPGGPGTSSGPSYASERAHEREQHAGWRPGHKLSPLLQAARDLEERFRRARAAADAPEMVAAILDTEAALWQWRNDPTQSDEQDRVRATLRTMVGTLGSVAETGTRDPAKTIGPYVEMALALRAAARAQRRFDDADEVRRQLADLGVEVRDGSEGSSWVLHGVEGGEPSC